jgi:DNA repair protein RecN (Recombination protein N)
MADFFCVPTILFDEVDANIGGITANMVGTALSIIGKKRQVLAVTHFVQVATKADAHFVLTKTTLDGRTISIVNQLDSKKALAKEHSRMVGIET